MLRLLDLSYDFSEFLAKRSGPLPLEYPAVHIRNTDYQTDALRLVNMVTQCTPASDLPIYIFTDSFETWLNIRDCFPGFDLRTLGLVQVDGVSSRHKAHAIGDPKIRKELVFESLADLILLGNATNLFVTRTLGRPGSPKSPISGFSRLALAINAQPQSFRHLSTRGDVRAGNGVRRSRILVYRGQRLAAGYKFFLFYRHKTLSKRGTWRNSVITDIQKHRGRVRTKVKD